jgi:UDP-GlcNAc:undecaprenyl-phosphate GlcNAc-1-phosphate transferase
MALLATCVFVVVLRPLAAALGLTDRPDERKHHVGDIPLVGGIAMFVSIALGLSIAPGIDGTSWYLILACAIVVSVGALDDRQSVHYLFRLAAQLLASLVMIFGAALYLTDIGDPFGFGIIYLGPAAIAGTLLVTLTVINAFNFIDGVDGLSGCIALIALTAGVLAGGLTTPGVEIAVVASAAIVGFLIFNFPRVGSNPFRTFMGDAGSTLLGLIVVWHTLSIIQAESRSISPVTGLWFALVPIADFFSCIVQRAARGKSPFASGREHFHHLLLREGLSDRQTVGTLACLSALYAGIGLFGATAGASDSAMFFLWFTVGVSQYWIVKWLAARVAGPSRWRIIASRSGPAQSHINLRIAGDSAPRKPYIVPPALHFESSEVDRHPADRILTEIDEDAQRIGLHARSGVRVATIPASIHRGDIVGQSVPNRESPRA